MPGAFAHLTLVETAMDPDVLIALPDFPSEALDAVHFWYKFRQMGAVGPDYPYMTLVDKPSEKWAKVMHYDATGSMVRAGVERLRSLAGDDREKCLSWLFGYASHVVGDATIHPIVYPYDDDKTLHRKQEMHQDVFIYKTLGFGEPWVSDILKSGIKECGSVAGVDRHILSFWERILARTNQSLYSKVRPDINFWHSAFTEVIDAVDDFSRLPKLFRHLGMEKGVVYPLYEEIDPAYVKNIKTPTGPAMDYEDVFAKAVTNVREAWHKIVLGVYRGDGGYLTYFKDWNLDTGVDNATGKLTFW